MPSLSQFMRAANNLPGRRFAARVPAIGIFEAELELADDSELAQRTAALTVRAVAGAPLDGLLAESFALTREAARRQLGLRIYDVQLVGGMVMAAGMVAEMKTGEGKTLTATLPMVLHALTGRGALLVTVNEYLAARDSAWMTPVYALLGLSVGVVLHDQTLAEKQAAYACDVTYVTNSELGFDYLRDNLAKSVDERVGRGAPFALVDEIDNILIDEARVPLIISGESPQDAGTYAQFARLAATMVRGERPAADRRGPDLAGAVFRRTAGPELDYDYEVDEKQMTVAVTERGVAKAEAFLAVAHLYRSENGHLVNHLHNALKAESLYLRDREYALVDGLVEIIDEHTGRILGGRRWSDGLHQAVEAKEGVPVTAEQHTIAAVTYQNLFRRYPQLCGMTGTALTEATELRSIYGLDVIAVPTNVPVTRVDRPDQLYPTAEAKWRAVVRAVAARQAAGQPVLVGTTSVEASESLSARFRQAGIAHTLLNARPERVSAESQTISQAGHPGAVTIATNMAGRGVDIKLGGDAGALAAAQLAADEDDVNADGYAGRLHELTVQLAERVADARRRALAAGGLLVLGTERHSSRRIDNQLRGRAGRQGDPGESRFIVSAEDHLLRLFAGGGLASMLARISLTDAAGEPLPIESKRVTKQIEKAQRKVEEQNFLERKHVLEYDDVANQQREVIYGYRDSILEGRELSPTLTERLLLTADELVSDAAEHEDFGLDYERLRVSVRHTFAFAFDVDDRDSLDVDELQAKLSDAVERALELRTAGWPADTLGMLQRHVALSVIDQHWQAMLADLDYLRNGIGLRGFAQLDPLVAYKNDAYQMFGQTMRDIWRDFTFAVFHTDVRFTDPADDVTPAPAAPRGRLVNSADVS